MPLVHFAGLLAFAGSLACCVHVAVADVAPQWRRILRLASGQVEPASQAEAA